jgi:hypothetical protein
MTETGFAILRDTVTKKYYIKLKDNVIKLETTAFPHHSLIKDALNDWFENNDKESHARIIDFKLNDRRENGKQDSLV